jgi:hypothetical protein
MHKVILLRLPPHSTHFLQPLDVVIFQQWRHWHAEAIDHAVQYGVGEFDQQTFLANIESIRKATFSVGNIKSAFRKCSFVPFRPHVVLDEITINHSAFEDGMERHQEEKVDSHLQEIWSSPKTHDKLHQQSEAIRDMLRSSLEPPDTPTRKHNRDNVETFMQTILAKDIIHKQLTDYMWNSRVTSDTGSERQGCICGRY